MRKISILFSLLLVLGTASIAQAGNNTFGVAWGLGVPLGATRDFTPDFSFRGASVEWRHFYMRNAAYGVNIGWNLFSTNDNSTVENGNLTVSGNRWKYTNAVPLYAGWFKYFGGDKRSGRWVVGLNAGTAWIEQRILISTTSITKSSWHFAFAPEVGMQMPMDSFLGYVGVRYHYALETNNMDAQQWLEFKIGFGFN